MNTFIRIQDHIFSPFLNLIIFSSLFLVIAPVALVTWGLIVIAASVLPILFKSIYLCSNKNRFNIVGIVLDLIGRLFLIMVLLACLTNHVLEVCIEHDSQTICGSNKNVWLNPLLLIIPSVAFICDSVNTSIKLLYCKHKPIRILLDDNSFI